MAAPTVVTADVVSAWASKINWTQAVGAASTAATLFFGHGLDAATQVSVVAGIQGVQALVTWYFRTFSTTTITPSSAANR